MKTNLKTKVMLAVLAGGMLCANGAWAFNYCWYGTKGGFVDVQPVPAVTTELDLTIDDSTTVGEGKHVSDLQGYDNIYAGYYDGQSGKKSVTGNSITFNAPNSIIVANTYTYGGYSGDGDVTNNTVTIEGGTFNGYIYGGYSWNGNASNNTVTINGGTFNGAYIFGGYGGASSSGNILNLNTKITGKTGKAGGVYYFQTMKFTLPAGITKDDTMLSTNALAVDWSNGTARINVYAANGVSLKMGDRITLIDVSENKTPDDWDGAYDNYVAGDNILGGAGKLVYKVNGVEQATAENLNEVSLKIILEMLQDFEQKSGGADQQKAPVEGIAAAMAMVNQSADLASGEGMNSLVAETAGGANTFAGMTAGSSKYKTGSHVDVDGWGVLVGAGTTKAWTNGSATTYGLFLEYGKGEFDTYNGAVHGDGDSENKGVGVMARHKLANNTYYEGNIRFGKQETDWSQSEIGGYETDSNYFGISLGIGHVFPAGKNELDVYGRYSYGRVGSSDAQVGSNHYDFDSVNSHRVRVGAKYNFVNENSKAKPFVGLAWEHEFDGEGNATISGVGQAPAPSMKGHTGIMEVGCDWNLSQKWTAGIGANGYIGKRKGWDGMARVMFSF